MKMRDIVKDNNWDMNFISEVRDSHTYIQKYKRDSIRDIQSHVTFPSDDLIESLIH